VCINRSFARQDIAGGNPQIKIPPTNVSEAYAPGQSGGKGTRSTRTAFANSTAFNGGNLGIGLFSAKTQLPDVFQNPPKTGFRCKAHGSIRIQEGEPTPNPTIDFARVSPLIA
jgi:hypothetical protein